mgnify:CR=1 FL=1
MFTEMHLVAEALDRTFDFEQGDTVQLRAWMLRELLKEVTAEYLRAPRVSFGGYEQGDTGPAAVVNVR